MSTIEHTIVTTFAQQLLQHDNENILNSSILKSLTIEYNNKLVEHNYGLSKNELKSKNIINLINICTYDKTSELHTSEKIRTPIVNYKDIDKKYYKTYNWLSYIPCLQKGAYRINIGRYIYFKIQNINIDEKSITIFMQDYTYNNGIWGVGVSGTATYKCNPKATFDKYLNTNMFITTTNIMLFPDLYTKIPYEELSWSQNRIKSWEDFIVKNAKTITHQLKQEYDTNNFDELTKYFQHFTILSNQLLYQHKPKAIRKPKNQTSKQQ